MEIGQAQQQLEQTRAVFRGVWPVARKKRHGDITLLAEPGERARIRQLSLTAPFLHCGNACEDLIQVMREAYTNAGECGRNGRGTGADTANTNLSGYNHTSPSAAGAAILWISTPVTSLARSDVYEITAD